MARSTYPSQNAQNTWSTYGNCDFEKVHGVCRAKHMPKSKCTKHLTFGPLLGIQMSFCVAGKIARLKTQMSKTWGFCNSFKSVGRRATFEEDLQRCIFRGRRNTRDMFIRDVRRSGRCFPETGCIIPTFLAGVDLPKM